MADTKISALPAVVTPAPTDELACNQAGASKKITIAQVLSVAYPVGSIYVSTVATNPNTLFGFGTWAAFGAGRVVVGLDAADVDFDVAEETGGAKTVTLATAEIPAHVHGELAPSSAAGGTLKFGIDTNASGSQAAGLNTASTGGGGAHNNVQPYIVCYMFKRTA